jgi:hypothetical protein
VQLVAQLERGDRRRGGEQHLGRLVGPAQPPVQVARPRERELEALRVRARTGAEAAQQLLRLLGRPTRRERAPERELGVEAAPGGDGRARETLGQRPVERRLRVAGGAHEQLG